jgi:hypothetical protein
MPRATTSPAIVPYGADETVYLVVDSFGEKGGAVYREAEFECADLETAISDMLAGQFNNPVGVIAYNTLEHWTEDVSAAVAAEIQSRCDMEGQPVPEHVGDFVTARSAAGRRPAFA